MGLRAARVADLLIIRRLERSPAATVLVPMPWSCQPSAAALALLSNWRSVGQRTESVVLSEGKATRGFIQARARPGRESWDIVRLACLSDDPLAYDRACADLIGRMCAMIAQRGALRTFARIPATDEAVRLFTESGFRPFATETIYQGTLRPLVEMAALPLVLPRPRLPRDDWDVFSLYCAVTPALVRHAESRSLREWTEAPHPAAALTRRWRQVREVVSGEPGDLQLWLRWQPLPRRRLQLLDLLVRPEGAGSLPGALRFAVEALGLDPDRPTLCRTREYDSRISATLEGAGFAPAARETLLVRHTAARVTERQLLTAALRAQGLGVDISHYRRGAGPVQQRLASSREVVHQYNGRYDRTSDHR
jgi:hypothetical protein